MESYGIKLFLVLCLCCPALTELKSSSQESKTLEKSSEKVSSQESASVTPKKEKHVKEKRDESKAKVSEPEIKPFQELVSDESKFQKAIKFKKLIAKADESDTSKSVKKSVRPKRKKKKGGAKYEKIKKEAAREKAKVLKSALTPHPTALEKENAEPKHREKRKSSRESNDSKESTQENDSEESGKQDESGKQKRDRDKKFKREKKDRTRVKKDNDKSGKPNKGARTEAAKLKNKRKATDKSSSSEILPDKSFEDQSKYEIPSAEYGDSSEESPELPLAVTGKPPDWSQYLEDYSDEKSEVSEKSSKVKTPGKAFKKLISKHERDEYETEEDSTVEKNRKPKKSFKYKSESDSSERSKAKHKRKSEKVKTNVKKQQGKIKSKINKSSESKHSSEEHGKAKHSSEEHGKAKHSSEEHGKAKHSSEEHGKAKHSSEEHGKAKHSSEEHGKAKHSSEEHGKAKHSSEERGKAKHSSEEHGKAKHSSEEHDRIEKERELHLTTRPRKVRKFKIELPPGRNETRTLLGTRSFYDLVTKSDTFVDKTELITDILCDEKILHFTRPRKWGRSMTIDMLKRFFELELDDYGNHLFENEKMNKKLFRGGIKMDLMPELDHLSTPRLRRKKKKLAAIEAMRYRISPALKISQDSKAMMHLGKYPVMVFKFKNLKGDSYEQIVLAMKNLIYLQFKRFAWLLKRRIGYANKKMYIEYLKMSMPDSQFIKTGIGFLTKMVHKIFKKRVVFFIDDEDYPVLQFMKNNYFDTEGLEKIHSMTKEFITKLGEDPNIHQGIIFGSMHIKQTTGILPEYYMPYSVNDPSYNTLLGFTDEEVDRLLTNTTGVAPVSKRDLKKWYSGYNMGGRELYNPWCVLNCIHNGGRIQPYFTQMPYTRILRKGIPRDVIIKLIHDEGVGVAYLHQLLDFTYLRTYQAFIKSLMHSGYLTNFRNKLYIPNKEIYNFFSNSTYFKKINQTRSAEELEIMHKKDGV